MNDKLFGNELKNALGARAMGQMDLVRRILATSSESISLQYINMIIHGSRIPPPQIVDRICVALRCPRDERKVFHRAAALDSGYEIGALR